MITAEQARVLSDVNRPPVVDDVTFTFKQIKKWADIGFYHVDLDIAKMTNIDNVINSLEQSGYDVEKMMDGKNRFYGLRIRW